MKYILIGLLLGIGLYSARLLFNVIEDILFCRLNKNDLYNVMLGNRPKLTKEVKNKIGF